MPDIVEKSTGSEDREARKGADSPAWVPLILIVVFFGKHLIDGPEVQRCKLFRRWASGFFYPDLLLFLSEVEQETLVPLPVLLPVLIQLTGNHKE